ncbi:type II secretion system secretin GspD [Fluviispira multicolorata]|uniref:Type II secretion system protein GspD n=1 Tax=Fluviispira multicolorata TaxID=2654512 RepID=A0A833N4G9_9BACT|nr:type II secretion system secretin GspD [Fluviispira multicolorata]KAB8032001.1 type II secretion system protein GspD [Fluviispira multicolorata]
MNQTFKRSNNNRISRIGNNKKLNFFVMTTVASIVFNSTVIAQAPPIPPLPPSPPNDSSKTPPNKNDTNKIPKLPSTPPSNGNTPNSPTAPGGKTFQGTAVTPKSAPQSSITSPNIPEKQNAKSQEKSQEKNKKTNPVDDIPHGKELVSIDFPNGANLSDIIKTIGLWTGKNFVLAQGVAGSSRISIISPEPVTKEEAYQAFLSALNISGFTTVDTGSVVKILPIANAKSSNIKTYYGENWSPSTDEIINQVIPLKYIDANSVINQLRPLLGITQYAAFTTTNSLILTDTGNRIRRILEVIKLLDSKTNQPLVSIVPINYMDAKDAVAKVNDIFGNRNGPSLSLQKVLADERTNSIILVGPASGLDDIVRFVQRIDKPAVDQNSQTMVRVRPLDYADSEKLAQTLQALTQNTRNQNSPYRPAFFQPPPPPGAPNAPPGQPQGQAVADLNGVKVTADKATNALVIQGSKSAYDELDGIIAQLDKRRAQVYVEANIIDMNINNGFNWKPATLGGATLSDGRYVMPFGFNAAQAAPFVVNQTNSTANIDSLKGAGDNFLLGILSNKSINLGPFTLTPGALLFALKQDSNSNILQTPSMMVSDNETANFQSNQQYSSVTTTANPNGQGSIQQVTKYDVTTSLKITPQISRADFVTMKINLNLDDAGPLDKDGKPNPISKRSAESTLIVQNGQTAVLGGITQDSHKVGESKVPLLGDIPILGWLFKSVTKEKKKTSLTLFVTPHIVRNSEDLEKIYNNKIKDRDLFLKIYYGEKYKDEEFYSILPNEEAGKAPKTLSKSEEQQENDKNQTYEPAPATKRAVLPSEDPNPINAPSSNSGTSSGGGFGFPSPPPPPPPPPYQ